MSKTHHTDVGYLALMLFGGILISCLVLNALSGFSPTITVFMIAVIAATLYLLRQEKRNERKSEKLMSDYDNIVVNHGPSD